MGYASSYCELCGGPTNLVVSETDGNVEFQIRPAHRWLTKIIGLLPASEVASAARELENPDPPRIVRGEMDDHGTLTAENGAALTAGWCGGYQVVHESCWTIAGRPEAADLGRVDASDLEEYQQQYFEFGALEAAGLAWTLDPPESSARNRERIERLTARVRAGMEGRAPRVVGTPDRGAKPPPPPVAPIAPATSRRFEKREQGEQKFWEIRVEGKSLTIHHGVWGKPSRIPFTLDFESPEAALREAESLMAKRTQDGYEELGS
jgi:predicted DNA-binding WGR domain protein